VTVQHEGDGYRDIGYISEECPAEWVHREGPSARYADVLFTRATKDQEIREREGACARGGIYKEGSESADVAQTFSTKRLLPCVGDMECGPPSTAGSESEYMRGA